MKNELFNELPAKNLITHPRVPAGDPDAVLKPAIVIIL